MPEWMNRFFKEPLTEREHEQIDFLLKTLVMVLIAVIFAAGVIGFIVTAVL